MSKSIVPSNQKSLEIYKPEELSTKVSNFPDVWQSKSLPLMKMEEQQGKQSILALVTLYIVAINENVNSFKTMTDQQIRLCAPMILEKFSLFKPEDLSLWFRLSISGDLLPPEKLKTIDCAVIHQLANAYIDKRLNAAENNSIKQHQSSKDLSGERQCEPTKIHKLLKGNI